MTHLFLSNFDKHEFESMISSLNISELFYLESELKKRITTVQGKTDSK